MLKPLEQQQFVTIEHVTHFICIWTSWVQSHLLFFCYSIIGLFPTQIYWVNIWEPICGILLNPRFWQHPALT